MVPVRSVIMLNQARFGRLAWLWLSVLVLVLDQLSKVYFEGALTLYQQIVLIPDYFSWTLAYNTGAAFSFLAGAGGWQRWFFAGIALVVSVVLVVWLKRLQPHETRLAIALALVLGGAIGNLFDRVAYGHVVDFILVHWQNRWYFPAFNVADMAISCGAALLALDMFKPQKSAELRHD
jgi:signal peptidase II